MSTPAHYKKILPVIQAFSEGKVVQFRYKNSPLWGTSNPDTRLAFDNPDCEWRIKPEPRRLWLNKENGDILFMPPSNPFSYIEYQEVLKDGE